MTQDLHAEFIRSKMLECGQVMIYRYIDETKKQLLGFRNQFDVDASGQLFIKLAGDFSHKYTTDLFPVEFFFYRKGIPYYITAKGIAVKLLQKPYETTVTKEDSIRAKIDSIEIVGLQKKKRNGLEQLAYGFLGL